MLKDRIGKIFGILNRRLFWFLVVLPSVIYGIYLGVLAQDVYRAEASIIVTKSQQSAVSDFGGSVRFFSHIFA